jgi:hypothetical protein
MCNDTIYVAPVIQWEGWSAYGDDGELIGAIVAWRSFNYMAIVHDPGEDRPVTEWCSTERAAKLFIERYHIAAMTCYG